MSNVRRSALCCGISPVTAIALAWDRPSSDLGISSYRLVIGTTDGFVDRSTSANADTITELAPGSAINVTIVAISSAGASPPSPIAYFTAGTCMHMLCASHTYIMALRMH